GGVAGFLVLAAGTLQFQIEAVAEPRQPLVEKFIRLLLASRQQSAADLALAADADRDQAVGAAVQPFAPNHRHAALLAFAEPQRDQVGKIAVAGLVLADPRQRRR